MEYAPAPSPTPGRAPSANRRWGPLVIAIAIVLTVLAAGGVLGWMLWKGRPGGAETVVFDVEGPGGATVPAEDVERVAEILRQRSEGLGAGEPAVEPAEGTVSVTLPRDGDTAEAVDLLERPGVLSFHPVVGVVDSTGTETGPPGGAGDDARGPASADEGEMSEEELRELQEDSGTGAQAADPAEVEVTLPDPDASQELQLGPARLGNAEVDSAEAALGPQNGQWQVDVGFTGTGGEEWSRLTGEAACHPQGAPRRRVAITVDNEIISAPEVGPDTTCDVGIDNTSTVITGQFTEQEARSLAGLVQVPPLPPEVEVSARR